MPSRFKGTPRQLRALNTYIRLRRASESINSRLNQTLDEIGLSESQFGVLEALLHLGELPQNVLAGKILRTSANITLVVSNLEKRRLVQRRRDAADKRVSIVTLTEEGRALIAGIFPAHVKRIAALMEVLSPAEMERLGRLCRKLGLGIEANAKSLR